MPTYQPQRRTGAAGLRQRPVSERLEMLEDRRLKLGYHHISSRRDLCWNIPAMGYPLRYPSLDYGLE
jgi:hypothetical protein